MQRIYFRRRASVASLGEPHIVYVHCLQEEEALWQFIVKQSQSMHQSSPPCPAGVLKVSKIQQYLSWWASSLQPYSERTTQNDSNWNANNKRLVDVMVQTACLLWSYMQWNMWLHFWLLTSFPHHIQNISNKDWLNNPNAIDFLEILIKK